MLRQVAVALALAAASPAFAERDVPKLTGPVVDEAGVIDQASARAIDALVRQARAAEGGNGVQLGILTVRSLEGEEIEPFSMRVAEEWKLGTKGKDNGVLIVVSTGDRKVRIEVGGGIEGGLTDAQSGRIIRDTLGPAFREERYGEGLYSASQQILAALGAVPAEQQGRQGGSTSRSRGRLCSFPVIVFVLLLMVIGRFGRRRRGFWGSSWPGSSWGGGGIWKSSGGSWGGGGGSFSGGGASGKW